MSSNDFALPRPWFLSLSIAWSSSPDFEALRRVLDTDDLLAESLPFHQFTIRPSRWHATAFAIAQFDSVAGAPTAEEFALTQLRRLAGPDDVLVERLRDCFAAFELEAHALHGYDAVTSVQLRSLEDPSPLAALRDRFRGVLEAPTLALLDDLRRAGVSARSLLDDANKNRGGAAYGSVARSPASEVGVRRWRREIPATRMRFDRVYLVCSDEALCNPSALSQGYVITSR